MQEHQPHMPSVAHVENRAKRLQDVLSHLSINPAAFARLDRGDAYAAARSKCLKCTNAHECLTWLAASGHTGDARPEFCPNLETFQRCLHKD
ncbi:MAG: DUF6455 family protein [Pseudomonadota bacterium]